MLLLASLLVGAYVLDFFDLSVPIVQVAGGFVVCSLAWSLLNQPDEPIEWVHEAAKPLTRPDLRTRAFYPLTMPLTVGPGAISVAITIGANQSQSVRSLIVNSAAHTTGIFVVALLVFIVLRYADTIMLDRSPPRPAGTCARTYFEMTSHLPFFTCEIVISPCVSSPLASNAMSAVMPAY